MQLYRFDREVAQTIEQYGSQATAITHVAREIADAHVAIMHIGPGGSLGYHRAVGDQLFLVVEGAGWVAGADRQRTAIAVGQAALWRGGEWHESGSDAGMTAVIVEAETLEPIMPEAQAG